MIRLPPGEPRARARLLEHARACGHGADRQACLPDRAAALTSLQFGPGQWEACRRFRLLGQPGHEVDLALGVSWREVRDDSAALREAIPRTPESPGFLAYGLHPSEGADRMDPLPRAGQLD